MVNIFQNTHFVVARILTQENIHFSLFFRLSFMNDRPFSPENCLLFVMKSNGLVGSEKNWLIKVDV